MNIGIIGCGNISTVYLRLAAQFRHLNFTACADINESAAQAQAELFGIHSMSIEKLLADDSLDLIVNLTVPKAHKDVSTRILQAGKHVYSEKPFVLTLDEGRALQALAAEQGLRIGSAPDTFLGGAHQCARELVDSGKIGRIIGGTCHFMNHGMENWHPSPGFFYQPGGGPMLDMGAYYISNLVQLIGPVKRVMAMSSQPFATRTISSEAHRGEQIPVNVATSIHVLMEFHSGAQITLGISWDVWQHEHNRMELYGTDATLHVPDPNFFGGELRISKLDEQTVISPDHPFVLANDEQQDGRLMANYRGAGLSDMIDAILQDKPHRCDDTLALHVVDVMTSAVFSGESGQAVSIATTCERPATMDADAAGALLR